MSQRLRDRLRRWLWRKLHHWQYHHSCWRRVNTGRPHVPWENFCWPCRVINRQLLPWLGKEGG